MVCVVSTVVELDWKYWSEVQLPKMKEIERVIKRHQAWKSLNAGW